MASWLAQPRFTGDSEARGDTHQKSLTVGRSLALTLLSCPFCDSLAEAGGRSTELSTFQKGLPGVACQCPQ